MKKNLLELEKSLFKPKKYYDYDDIKYKEIRYVGSLFDEDNYKPIQTISVFDYKNNYIEYVSRGDKDKILSIKEYLDMIRPYLSDIINDYKTHGKLKYHSGNKVFGYKTEGEWKIQLSMKIIFVSSKDDSDEIREMHTKGDNIHIVMGSETDDIIKELFKSLLRRYQEGLEE